jgi:putative ABC transport system permease protein
MKIKNLAVIAWRNIAKSPRRALLFGAAIFFSCFLLLFSQALFNGSEAQILRDMNQIITGETGIYWNSIKDYSRDEPQRAFASEFDPEKDEINRNSLDALGGYLKTHIDKIERIEPYIIRILTVHSGRITDKCLVYGIRAEDFRRLENIKVLQSPDSHELLLGENEILVSEDFADFLGVKPGGSITLSGKTMFGSQNALEVKARGFYKNKAPWINRIVFAQDSLARELLDVPAPYFSSQKIFFKPGVDTATFTSNLKLFLDTHGGVLTAETGKDAARFFSTMTESQKSILLLNTLILFLVIGMGLRSTTRMVLFQRMREFGTLRAIGFTRLDCLVMIVLEVLILGLIALGLSVILVLSLTWVLSHTGIRVPFKPLQFMFGGDIFFPLINPLDFLLSLGLIAFLAILSPFKPAGILLYNKITDILNLKQKRVYVIPAMIKSLFTHRKSVYKSFRETE